MEYTPLEWQAHEYIHSDKTTDWYWSVGLIAIVLAIVAILMHNLLFALLIVIGTAALLIFAIREPREILFQITRRGIVVDDTLYPHSTLESFWVEDKLFQDKLIVKSKKPFMPLIIIPLEDVEPHEVRELLKNHLVEEEQAEPFSHTFMERLGF